MSSVGATPAWSTSNGTHIVPGRLLGGAGVVSRKAGKGFSVAYVSAGRYRVTTDVNFPVMLAIVADLYQATGSYYTVKVVAYSVGQGAGNVCSFDLLVANAGTPTDLGAAEEVHFIATYARTVVP